MFNVGGLATYEDFGGAAYRSGMRIAERCNWRPRIRSRLSLAGIGPNITRTAGEPVSVNLKADRKFHVALGDWPVTLALYRQNTIALFIEDEEVRPVNYLAAESCFAGCLGEYGTHRWIDTDAYRDSDRPCVLEIAGSRIEIYWTLEDNFYQYAKLEHEDGTIWAGWSGFGVGEGAENRGYGFSSADRDRKLRQYWPGVLEKRVVAMSLGQKLA